MITSWPLSRILTEVAVGSGDWTWKEEFADLEQRHAETGYLTKLEEQIRECGITMPVLIGSDGRLWDGHHRIYVALRLDFTEVPVEIVEPTPESACEPMSPEEMYDALHLVAEMCDIADREGTPVTTDLVRKWLKGPQPGQRVSFPPFGESNGS